MPPGAGRLLQPRSSRATEIEFFADQLLDRWGVVFRDVLARETLAPAVARSAAGLPPHGSARRNSRRPLRQDFVGEQFARPEALDLLRHLRRSAKTGEQLEIAPADPLNLDRHRASRARERAR